MVLVASRYRVLANHLIAFHTRILIRPRTKPLTKLNSNPMKTSKAYTLKTTYIGQKNPYSKFLPNRENSHNSKRRKTSQNPAKPQKP